MIAIRTGRGVSHADKDFRHAFRSVLRATVVGLAALFASALPTSAAAQGSDSEEAAIKKVIETMVRAVNKDQLNVMLAQFADDAVIDSSAAGGKVSKVKYGQVMADVFQKGNLISADVRDMNVTMTGSSRATVLGTVYLQTRTARPTARVEYKLEKRDGRWLIVETNRK